ncbi:hypothetical protein [Streptomyces sp. NPDC101776]|uniref:hypothetical protein n=1 Tax=Streptomyces sp. NPDC101776 TaxID=3366146 RepID=UPI003803475A
MSGILGELGKKLAERWLTLLVLPGALYLAVSYAAVTLGHSQALDAQRLMTEITDRAADPAVKTAGGQIALLAAVLGGAAALGLAAQALGSLAERLVLAAGWQAWPAPLSAIARRAVAFRAGRWAHLDAVVRAEQRRALAPAPADRPDPQRRLRAAHRRSQVSVEPPERPTWSGDRIQAAALRLDRDHHLDLFRVWPQLWLVLPDPVRAEIISARSALTRAANLAGWSVLYAPLAWWWWPAIPLAAVLMLIARHRIRSTIDAYAGLVEAAARVHATTLAAQLGIDHTGPLSTDLGDLLYRQTHP